MAWWTKIVDAGTLSGIKQHKTKLDATIRLTLAVGVAGASREGCGLYRRNPDAFPDEPNLLPAEMAKAEKRKARMRRR